MQQLKKLEEGRGKMHKYGNVHSTAMSWPLLRSESENHVSQTDKKQQSRINKKPKWEPLNVSGH
ncbi:unnamed protein product [Sphenostylis stenocarpa]|uniref:Uncharacterized protein n=1 Tax=Sphenostylis stenocarpa TaxID=92480 RepID=A0AA86W305_9FABA|nr:unnamed protein product [Sphenostylis stenocarpa]